MQGSAAFPLLELSFPTLSATSAQALTRDRVSFAPSNPWGLQEAVMPLMEISHPEGATEASVTYPPLEDLSYDVSSASKLLCWQACCICVLQLLQKFLAVIVLQRYAVVACTQEPHISVRYS